MGYYINPENMSKEEFLKKHGKKIVPFDFEPFDFNGDSLPVCLVDNGWMTAAGIGYDRREAEVFLNDSSGRPKTWYLVSKKDLEPYYKEIKNA